MKDERFETHPGPCAERVVVCRGCRALWIEEWTVLWIGDSERDDLRYLPLTEGEAEKQFDRC